MRQRNSAHDRICAEVLRVRLGDLIGRGLPTGRSREAVFADARDWFQADNNDALSFNYCVEAIAGAGAADKLRRMILDGGPQFIASLLRRFGNFRK